MKKALAFFCVAALVFYIVGRKKKAATVPAGETRRVTQSRLGGGSGPAGASRLFGGVTGAMSRDILYFANGMRFSPGRGFDFNKWTGEPLTDKTEFGFSPVPINQPSDLYSADVALFNLYNPTWRFGNFGYTNGVRQFFPAQVQNGKLVYQNGQIFDGS